MYCCSYSFLQASARSNPYTWCGGRTGRKVTKVLLTWSYWYWRNYNR